MGHPKNIRLKIRPRKRKNPLLKKFPVSAECENNGAHPSAIGTNLCRFRRERERDIGGSLSKLEVSWKYHDVSDLAEAAMPRD